MENVLVASIVNAIMGLVDPGKVQAVKINSCFLDHLSST